MATEPVDISQLNQLESQLTHQIEQLYETQLLLIKELAAIRIAVCFGEAGRQSLRRQKSFLEKDYFPNVAPPEAAPEGEPDSPLP